MFKKPKPKMQIEIEVGALGKLASLVIKNISH